MRGEAVSAGQLNQVPGPKPPASIPGWQLMSETSTSANSQMIAGQGHSMRGEGMLFVKG